MERKKFISPKIMVEYIVIEESIANGSTLIRPGDETGIIVVDDWEEGSDIQSTEGNSRW